MTPDVKELARRDAEKRAREFVETGFGSLGIVNLEPYIKIVAELIEGATLSALESLRPAAQDAQPIIDWLEQRARLSSFAEEQEKFRAAAALLRVAPVEGLPPIDDSWFSPDTIAALQKPSMELTAPAEGPPEGFVMVPTAAVRCMKTGNPFGTDTWQAGHACDCGVCRAMLAASHQPASGWRTPPTPLR